MMTIPGPTRRGVRPTTRSESSEDMLVMLDMLGMPGAARPGRPSGRKHRLRRPIAAMPMVMAAVINIRAKGSRK